jgi:hypothetical protein
MCQAYILLFSTFVYVWKPFLRNASKYCQMLAHMLCFPHEVEPICETAGN